MCVNTTLLALLLALKELDVPLNLKEKDALKKASQQLELDPGDWNYIEQGLMRVISANSSLHQQYQAIKVKLDEIDGNILLNLLPTKAELEQELATDSTREIRGYKPGESAESDSNIIINSMVSVTLRSDDPPAAIKKKSFLDRIKKWLDQKPN
ncbi:hypothetical protein [Brasilonema sp. UFV-L1]|uniref:hypothetical protein n=1 Tax=Brasilonema sp. UFV-L1 TaxID=2234130 RepID=UPI00145E64EC|nr:hypothetical protein [Brasilonema sp. UFV-L1]NMG09787.1 hypothetical protein [Brasilonema sp. UFV-L1]